jgi:hypothetical protein
MNYDTKHYKKIKDYPLRVILGPFPNKAYAKLVAVSPLGKQHYVKWLNAQDAEEIIKITETGKY